MKYLITILLLSCSQLYANDSTAHVHLTKAKTNAIASLALATIGGITGYTAQGERNQLLMSYTFLAASSVCAIAATYHYNAAIVSVIASPTQLGIKITW
jgi:hypothetical protein